MTLNYAPLEDILKLCAKCVSDFCVDFMAQDHPFEASFRVRKQHNETSPEVFGFCFLKKNVSNHHRLHRDKLRQDLIENMQRFEGLLRKAFPVLDNDRLSYEIEYFPAKTEDDEPHWRLSIQDSERSNPALPLPEALATLSLLHDRIGKLSSGSDVFLISDIRIPAASPRDALRVFLALHHPDLFTTRNGSHPSFTVSKICPVSFESAVS